MKLNSDEALKRLRENDHGILCTLHATRGVDAVPVVYVAHENGFVGVPIDHVKPKDSLRLQRERNLEADSRATLLVEHWDRNDWTRLWWVRAELRWQNPNVDFESDRHCELGREVGTRAAEPNGHRANEQLAGEHLARRFVQYVDKPYARILILRIDAVTGWAASTTL
jgi:hypothetical protein